MRLLAQMLLLQGSPLPGWLVLGGETSSFQNLPRCDAVVSDTVAFSCVVSHE